ncbi:MAG: hypothetical protein K9M56_07030 [Victivallales bacterium]|nr:hypothetical protein [Victivallales bacterium]
MQKFCFLDLLGAVFAGTTSRSSQLAASFAQKYYSGSLTVIGAGGGKANLIGAAFANSFQQMQLILMMATVPQKATRALLLFRLL